MRNRRRNHARAVSAAIFCACGLVPLSAQAQNTVYFSTSSIGQYKGIANWGVEVVDGSSDNMRQSIANMGVNNINLIATNFFVDEPLQANGQISTIDQGYINSQLAVAAMAGKKPLVMGPNVGDTDSSYLASSGVNIAQWAAVLEATKSYYNSQGWTISAAMPFNEPDYWSGQGTPQNLHDIMSILKSAPNFQGVGLMGASTLDSDSALTWYNAISGIANYGSTHVLGGSATSYANFFQQVTADGGTPAAPELHDLGEAIYAAEYGAQQGIWWGPALQARGQFVQSSQGQQLGYAQNLPNDTAAAVYRAPNGSIQAFAGGFERMGTSTPYRFVSTDRPVFFNGVGPISQYMVQVGQGGEAYANVQYGANVIPALDGNEWEIVNRQNGQVLQVAGAGTSDGALLNVGTANGGSYQKWNIIRNQDGYYALYNANSGLTADIYGGSLADGGSADQWGMADNLIQQWYIQPAGNGYYYLRNGNSNSYLTGNATNAYQLSSNGSSLEQWQFVLANPAPTGTLTAQYNFSGNVNDNTGVHNATAFGTPTYVAGPTTAQGQAISLNGTNAYVQLPSGVANTKDITVSAWVKWNGGNAWQRIFDFGNNTTSYMFLTPQSGDGTMRFAITNTGNTGEQILDTDPLPTGQWVHLAVTLNGDTGVLYVNGVPTVAGQIAVNPGDFDPTLNYIGKSQYAGDPLFNGSIDDFRIYDYALNQSQIASLLPISHYSWTGSVSSVWSTATLASPKNWKLAFDGTPSDYFDNDTVVFDDSATSFTVNTASNVSPVSTVFYNSFTYTFTGAAGITGAGSMTMNGAGIVNINNVNSYTGATTINTGTLNLNGSLNGSAVNVNAGTLSEGSSGAIGGNVALTNIGYVWLGGTNALATIRSTGPGTITVNGGTTSASGLVSVGDTTGDNAALNVTGGVLNANSTSIPSIVIGSADIATGTMTISSGTVNTASELWVSSATGATGTLNVTGGTLNTGSWLAIGRGGNNGNLNVTGGNVNVNGANLTLASFAGNVGQASISGGTVTTVNGFYVGESGTGTLTISGAGNVVVNGAEGLRVGRNAGSIGTVNLNAGGTLTTTAATGGTGTSTFNFNGGALTAATSNTAFLQGLTVANVRSGGAIINTNGNSITIAQSLLHDPALGSTPDGGLTQNGSGTLTLSATNTYSGSTTIKNGSIVAAGTNSIPTGSPVTIAGPGTLSVTGTNTLKSFSGAGTLSLGPTASVKLQSGQTVNNIGTLTINSGGVLDVTNNTLFINYGAGTDPVSTIRTALVSGAARSGSFPTWTGAGIISSSAANPLNNSGSGATYSVGYVDGADNVLGSPIAGEQAIQVGWMLQGDLNGDGKVDGIDFNILVHNFGQTGTTWDTGDITYDGKTDGFDFNALVHNFGQTAGGGVEDISPATWEAVAAFGASIGDPVALPSSVPEPATFGVMVLGGFAVLSRRRRAS